KGEISFLDPVKLTRFKKEISLFSTEHVRDIKVGHSTNSETEEVTVHDIGNETFYIDTSGFDDSDENKNDEENKRLIFQKMLDSGISKITTILWFVTSDAKFIELLAKDYDNNVWDNTIIVTKGNKIKNGPREAARQVVIKNYKKKYGKMLGIENNLLAKTTDLAILLFESLPNESIYVKMNLSSDQLNEFCIYKASEPDRILAKYKILMEEHSKHPICLNFKIIKCLRCPKETDPRLADPKCHLEVDSVHSEMKQIYIGKIIYIYPNSLYKYHSDQLVAYHAGSLVFGHPGKPIDSRIDNSPGEWAARILTLGDITNPMIPGYW
ncbi:1580_t:CDS:2, partial [Racocetra fulgida]